MNPGTCAWWIPDNRRPVDFRRLKDQLRSLRSAAGQDKSSLIAELLKTPEDGRIKLCITNLALEYRRTHSALFMSGLYSPLMAFGRRKNHIVAFARRHDRKRVIAAAARFFLKLNPNGDIPVPPGAWDDTTLPLPRSLQGEHYRDVLTDRTIRTVMLGGKTAMPVSDIFSTGLPVALLEVDG